MSSKTNMKALDTVCTFIYVFVVYSARLASYQTGMFVSTLGIYTTCWLLITQPILLIRDKKENKKVA